MAITKQLIYYLNAFPIVLQEIKRDGEKTTQNFNFLQNKIICDGRPVVDRPFFIQLFVYSL